MDIFWYFTMEVNWLFLYLVTQALDCPSGWDGYGNSCYKFVVQSISVRGLNWENARRDCLGYGGDLVSIANKSEMSFIYGISSKVWNQHYWIGLNDQRNESQFVWSDGMPYNASVYSNWYPGEPNDRADEDCVELYGRRWNDNSCKKEYGYICKRPKGKSSQAQFCIQLGLKYTNTMIPCRCYRLLIKYIFWVRMIST